MKHRHEIEPGVPYPRNGRLMRENVSKLDDRVLKSKVKWYTSRSVRGSRRKRLDVYDVLMVGMIAACGVALAVGVVSRFF